MGLGTQVHTSIFQHCVSVAGVVKRWSASSLLLDYFFLSKNEVVTDVYL